MLVLYYSRTGRTETLANPVAEGTRTVEDVSVSVKRVDYATVNDFISCDAVAFGSPNYFSYMAGLMKDFFDKALSIRERVIGKPAVAFTSGGGSSNSALLSLENMISSFKLQKVAEGVVSQGEPNEKDLTACKKLGEALTKAAIKRAEAPKD
ncbi:MAG: flavodoxin domain-containing protein [Candidatus Bathyarchaeia archaeon]|nr:flavodoxin domain-containing protein [Candidatus Bathyarchaeia archaeon]